jgi:hypothetical protein
MKSWRRKQIDKKVALVLLCCGMRPRKQPFAQDKEVLNVQREDLTGGLAPLADANFFNKFFIDCGEVAWPGEIDLAPDAIYATIAGQQLREPRPPDPPSAHL